MVLEYITVVILCILVGLITVLASGAWVKRRALKLPEKSREGPSPLSVNYHFTRQCNYQCGFCFHTAKTSYVLPIDEAKRGLKMLKKAGRFVNELLSTQIHDWL